MASAPVQVLEWTPQTQGGSRWKEKRKWKSMSPWFKKERQEDGHRRVALP